jgi:hypothetical protein
MSPATFRATSFLASSETGESPMYMSKKAPAHQTRVGSELPPLSYSVMNVGPSEHVQTLRVPVVAAIKSIDM